jgi:CheY-like chemotaxis protein
VFTHVNRPAGRRGYPLGAMARVLVIDDEPDVRWLIRMSLERAGHEVLDAEDGLRGIALAMKQRPEVIVLDLMMPVMDGWTFREEQRKLPALASIPVLTVTADGDARGKAASIQAAGYIAKPLQIDNLLDEVERICGLPES